jgi:hypothetical protein
MKKTLIRLVLLAAALLAMSATTAMADGGGFPPLCPWQTVSAATSIIDCMSGQG